MSDVLTLIERCRQKDELAWEQLVRTYQGRVYAVACCYVRDHDEARDLAQAAFVRVYQKIGSYNGGEFLPWLLRLVRNLCVDHLRRRRLLRLVRNLCVDHLRRRKARPRASDLPFEQSAEFLPDAGPSPEQAWLSDTRRRLVLRALRRITGPSREMILLKEIQGLKLREIAALLELPVGTVKSRSSRARIELAKQVLELDPSYGTPSAGTRPGGVAQRGRDDGL